MKTGLFESVGLRLYRLNYEEYDLILTPKFESPKPVYKLKGIDVIDVEGVDPTKFSDLASEYLVGRQISLHTADYAAFVERLFELLKQSIDDETKREWTKPPWIELTLDKKHELTVLVTPEFAGCSTSAPRPCRK